MPAPPSERETSLPADWQETDARTQIDSALAVLLFLLVLWISNSV